MIQRAKFFLVLESYFSDKLIFQAAISDDESPPATHKPQPPKFNTAVLSRPSPPLDPGLPNYENVGHGTVTSQHNGVTSHQMTQARRIKRREKLYLALKEISNFYTQSTKQKLPHLTFDF